MDFQHYITPENVALAAGIVGGIVTLALVGLIIWNRRSIAQSVTSMWASVFSQGGLFYFGMTLFMLASVVEAGPVLNKIAMHGALFGYGGHMLVFAFDMIAAVSLRARLNARRVFDTRGMRVQMWGIWLPALVSILANLAGALQNFNAGDFSHLFIFAWLLPLIGAVFPSMIVVLSLAADHLIDTTAINDKIDPEDFKRQEKKRIDILKVRLSTEEEMLKEEQKIAEIRRDRDEAQGRASREWFFMRWLRPESAAPMAIIKAEIEKEVNEARANQEQQTNAQAATVATTLNGMQQALATITDQLAHLTTTQQALAQQVNGQGEHLHHLSLSTRDQHQQFTTFKTQCEGIASTIEQLTASFEALEVNHTSRAHEGSKRKGLNLHTIATGSSEGATQKTGEMNLSRRDRAFLFIGEYQRRNQGAEPTLEEIMEAVDCSQGSASNYRSDYRKVQTGEVAAMVGVANGHHSI